MTQQEYNHLQAQLSRLSEATDKKAQAELKALLLKHARKAVTERNFDRAGYTASVKAIMDKYSKIPAEAAQKIADRALSEAIDKSGLRDSPLVTQYQRTLFAGQGQAGDVTFVEHPVTHKVIAIPQDQVATFIDRFNLSTTASNRPLKVWQTGELINEYAKKQEATIMATVQSGLASGLDPVQIAKDMDKQLTTPLTRGSWGKLKAPPEDYHAIYDKLIDDGYSPQQAGKIARAEYKDMTGKTLSIANEDYIRRIGMNGPDFQSLRLIRTEQSVMLNNRQAEIARTNPAVDNQKAEIVLEAGGRPDSWNCHCQEWAKLTKGGKIVGPDGYFLNDDGMPLLDSEGNRVGNLPAHPNCSCILRPVLLAIDDFIKKVLAKT